MRIDLYLWTVRYFRSRNKATLASKKGIVFVNAKKVKPSYEVLVDDVIILKKKDVVEKFIVLDFPKSRVGPKLVDMYRMKKIDNSTRISQKSVVYSRKKGEGRPTKKERRDLDNFLT